MALRVRDGLLTEAGIPGNNVAVAKVEIDGVIDYITKMNSPLGHSEELIAAEIIRLRADGKTVVTLQLFTERIPCAEEGTAACRAMIQQHMPEAHVFVYTRSNTWAGRVQELWSIYSR